jgi:hypothetical protein
MTRKDIDKYRLMRKLGSKEPNLSEKAKYLCANCKFLPASGRGLCRSDFKESDLPFNYEKDLEINIMCFEFEERK